MSTTRMLIDATHPEETRVVVLNGNRLDEFDVEVASRKQLKGNIYLAKVVRVEPSLQAAFVEYGGNRHGFLSFSEIHPDYYQIPVADREALMVEHDAQVAQRAAEGPGESVPETDSQPDEPSEASSESSAAALESASDTVQEQPQDAGQESDQPSAEEPGQESEETSRENDAPQAEGSASPPGTVETVGGDDREETETRRPKQSSRHYRIQEVIKRRQILLVQVVKEERGNKGAALTTYLSLAGRYCVLMPNTARGGGVSRKITSGAERDKLKKILTDLDIPEGMGVIVRTAGKDKTKTEIKRDCTYLLKLWDSVREMTLKSVAPCLVYEEASLIKRAIRDMYSSAIDEIHVQGDEAFRTAKDLMKMLVPSHAKRVQLYTDATVPLFLRYKVESQIDGTHNPTVQLPSGGYIVINPTEALVAIDVNSGRSTRERNIEETALKTNMEAAEEVARQLRLRDLAGLIVIDFIDMEASRNNAKVERQLKDAMRTDRARIQLGRISPFGLLELSRQRLRPSLFERSFGTCLHCSGTGIVRSPESTSLHVLRAIEEEGIRNRGGEINVRVPMEIALYVLNHQRQALAEIEKRYEFSVAVDADDSLIPPNFKLDHKRGQPVAQIPVKESREEPEMEEVADDEAEPQAAAASSVQEREASAPGGDDDGRKRGRRRRRRRKRGDGDREHGQQPMVQQADQGQADQGQAVQADDVGDDQAERQPTDRPGAGELMPDGQIKRRRRGRRGGRRRNRRNEEGGPQIGSPVATNDGASLSVEAHPFPLDHSLAEGDAETSRATASSHWPLDHNTPEAGSPGTPEAREQQTTEVERTSENRDLVTTSARTEPSPATGRPPQAEEPATDSTKSRRGWWDRFTS